MKQQTPTRDRNALRRHFDIERELADRLRHATKSERVTLYRDVYNELFQRVPDHPQNVWKADAQEQEARAQRQLRLLGHFLTPSSTYLEIGAGDCHLAKRVAERSKFAYAVDVSDVIADDGRAVPNFRFLLSDGVQIDVPAGTVDVAYSNQLMEHLHPQDAEEQLRHIANALAPEGQYLCVTPHRYSGPHDISQFFSTRAEGFHLKEYTYRELRQLMLRSGFTSTTVWAGVKGRFFRLPQWIVLGTETLLGLLNARLRRAVTRSWLFNRVFGNVTLVGHKTGGAPAQSGT
jgi:SAM-dependent methyltransferase